MTHDRPGVPLVLANALGGSLYVDFFEWCFDSPWTEADEPPEDFFADVAMHAVIASYRILGWPAEFDMWRLVLTTQTDAVLIGHFVADVEPDLLEARIRMALEIAFEQLGVPFSKAEGRG